MIEKLQAWLAAGDIAVTTMGPVLTFLLAAIAGGAMTQVLKLPLGHALKEPWFSYATRAIAITGTVFFAHFLSNSLSWPLELVAGVTSIMLYHGGVSVIRHFWPWLEIHPLIGSATPSTDAWQAAADR